MPPSTQASRIDRMMPEARPDRVPARLLRCVVRRLSVAVLAGLAAAAAPRDADRLRSPDDLRALEARIGAVAGRVRETVVAIVVPDDGGAERGSGSGTIISPDGWVLTAGHVGQAPGKRVTVLLADGTALPGMTAGQHFGPDGDFGLVKIDAKSRVLPAAPMGSSAALRTGQPVLALGHPLGPERNPWRPPPLRVGRVIGRDGWLLAIDAPLSPGDSGGAVFNLDGELVGVNSAASARPDMNLAGAIDSAKERMESLREGLASGKYLADPTKDPMEAAQEERSGGDGDEAGEGERDGGAATIHAAFSSAVQDQRERGQESLEALAALNEPYADAMVSVLVDARDACQGVLVGEDGLVLTKASELGMGIRRIEVVLGDGSTAAATLLATDQETDLAIIRPELAPDGTPVPFGETPEPALGGAVITVSRGMSPMALGFRSLGTYASGRSDAASRAMLGVSLRPPTEAERAPLEGGVGQVVAKVLPGSGAAAAGIAEGDVLLRVGGTTLSSAESAAVPLGMRAPGDEVQVEWIHGGERRTAEIRLLRPAGMEMRRALSQGAEPSRRATGFGEVIQHDGIVPAQGVGGPVIDSSGRVVGLNIARADRMKTYALASGRVRKSLDGMLARIAAGEVLVAVDPTEGLAVVGFDPDGFARLGAASARVLGPTNKLEGLGDAATIDGWGDPDDMAFWLVDIPSPGRYDVSLDAEPRAGGKVDVFLGNELMTVPVGRRARGLLRAGEVLVEDAGPAAIRVQPLGRPTSGVMSLRGIRVQRTDQLRIAEAAWPLLRWRDPDRYRREWEREERKRKRDEARRKQGQEDAR
jgi:serine protease Do